MKFLNKIEKKLEEDSKKRKNIDVKQKIILKHGLVINSLGVNKNIDKDNNYFIIFQKQLLYFAKFFFTKIPNVMNVIIPIIIIILGRNYSFYRGDIIEYFLISIFFLNFLIELFWSLRIYDLKKILIDKNFEIFKIKFEKDKNFKLFHKVKSEQINIGDIIKLKHDEESPCNILLLAADQYIDGNYYGFIDNSSNSENIEITKIKTINLTKQKNCDLNQQKNLKNWLKPLNLKIEYKLNGNNYRRFKGDVKAKNDPKPEYCNYKNLIPKGAILKSKWIYGLCLDSGKENIYIQKKDNLKSYNNIIKIIEYYSLIMICISIIFIIIQFLILTIWKNTSEYLRIIDPKTSNGLRFFSIILLYFPCLPFCIYFGIDIFHLVKSLLIESNFEKCKNSFLKIINKDVLTKLGKVNEVVLSKTKILSSSEMIIDNIYLNENIYKFDKYDTIIEEEEKMKKKVTQKNENSNLNGTNKSKFVKKKIEFVNKESNININEIDEEDEQNILNNFETKDTKHKIKNENKEIKEEIIENNTNKESEVVYRTLSTKNIKNDINKNYSIFKIGTIKINNNENLNIKNEEDFKNDYIIDSDLLDLLKCFLLCNNLSIGKNDTDNIEIDDIYEKAQLKLSNFINYNIEYKIPSNDDNCIYKFQLKLNDIIETYEILFSNFSDNPDREIYTVVVKDQNSQYSVYCRLNPNISQDVIQFDKLVFDNFNNSLIYNYDKGLNSYVYAKKNLTKEDAEYIISKNNQIKKAQLNREFLYQKLAIEIEKDLDFISTVGFKEKINKNALTLIDGLMSNKVKINLLTSDSYLNAIQIGYNYKLLNNNEDTFFYDFKDEESAILSIKNTLEELKKYKDSMKKSKRNKTLKDKQILLTNETKQKMETMNKKFKIKKEKNTLQNTFIKDSDIKKLSKFNLIISGKSISLIIKNSFLYYHFNFILKFCKTIIGFSMFDFEKGILTEIIKKNSDSNIMAIGCGINDHIMMECSDISIQYSGSDKEINGDIILNKLENLKKLIYENGVVINSNLENFVNHSIYMNLVFWFSTVFFQLFFYFSGISIFNSLFIILANLLMNTLVLLTYCWGEDYYGQLLRNKFSAIYNENLITNKKFFKKMLIILAESFIISIINCSIIIFIGFSIIKSGLIANYHILINILYLIIFITSQMRIYIHSRSSKKIMLISLLFNTGLILLFIFLIQISINSISSFLFFEIFNFPELIILLIVIIILNSVIIEFNKYFFFVNIEYPLFNIIKSYISENCLDILMNQFLISKLKIRVSFSKILKNTFNDNTHISSLIDKLINYFDSSNSQYIDFITLKFKNYNLEKKFKIFNKNNNLNQVHFLNFVFFIITLVLEILTSLRSNQSQNIYINLTNPILILWFNLWFFLKYVKNKFDTIFPLFFTWVIGIKILSLVLTGNSNIWFYFTFLFYITSLKNINFITYLILIGVNFLSLILIQIFSTNFRNFTFTYNTIILMVIYFLIVIILNFILIISKYFSIKYYKEEFMESQKLNLESSNSNDMLSLLMPKFVIDKIGGKIGSFFENEISDDVGKLTVLFCDIMEFDKILELYGNEIVQLLDLIFRKFDDLCIKYGVQKIETVGKTYMAASGIKFVEEKLENKFKNMNQTKRVIDLAKEMLYVAKSIILKNEKSLVLKIGVHYGDCMMGVIGYHKPQFSLIGDTVNFTSRHCSTGLSNHIMISEAAFIKIKEFDLLDNNRYVLEQIKTPMKGKGGAKAPITVNHVYEKTKQSLFNKKLNNILRNKSVHTNESKIQFEKIENLNKYLLTKKDKPFAITKFSILLEKLKKNNLKMNNQKSTNNKLIDNSNLENQKVNAFSEKISVNSYKIDEDFIYNLNEFEFDEIDYQGNLLKLNKKIFNSNLFNDLVEKILKLNNLNLKIIYIIFFIYYVFATILYILYFASIIRSQSIYIILIIFRGLVMFLFLVIIFKYFDSKKCSYLMLTLFYIIKVFNVTLLLWRFKYQELLNVYFLIILEIILNWVITSQIIPLFLESYVNYYLSSINLWLYSSLIVIIIFDLNNRYSVGEVMVFFWFINYSLWVIKFIQTKSFIKIYNNINISKKKNNEIEDFVDRLLPKHIQENINNKNGQLGESYENVTLLFADICGFTNYSSGKTPKEVVKMLSELFKDFDKCCNDLNLYKVCTIGDCYVVMGFLDKNTRKSYGEEAIDVIRLGLQFIEKIAEVRKKINYDGLHMRIGIHTGDIIGGVIGTDVVRFDIYGPDVSIANKMESNGKNDRVAVSEDTMNFVWKTKEKNNFEFTEHNVCNIESLNKKVKSYFVKEIDQYLN